MTIIKFQLLIIIIIIKTFSNFNLLHLWLRGRNKKSFQLIIFLHSLLSFYRWWFEKWNLLRFFFIEFSRVFWDTHNGLKERWLRTFFLQLFNFDFLFLKMEMFALLLSPLTSTSRNAIMKIKTNFPWHLAMTFQIKIPFLDVIIPTSFLHHRSSYEKWSIHENFSRRWCWRWKIMVKNKKKTSTENSIKISLIENRWGGVKIDEFSYHLTDKKVRNIYPKNFVLKLKYEISFDFINFYMLYSRKHLTTCEMWEQRMLRSN